MDFMKYSLLIFSLVVGIYSFSQGAFAQQVKESAPLTQVDPVPTLITQPATIDHNWQIYHKIDKKDPLSFSQQKCQKNGILNFIKDPNAFFAACPDAGKKVPPSYEPVGDTKIPPLDSGVSVTVTKF